MKIIDLLNKIANGEKPPKFEYYGGIYEYDRKTEKYWFNDMWFDFNSFENINDEIEIIKEEKKIPEKLYEISNIGDLTIKYPDNKQLMDKINEIIDCIKSKGDE